jgi:hypothetical protein
MYDAVQVHESSILHGAGLDQAMPASPGFCSMK